MWYEIIFSSLCKYKSEDPKNLSNMFKVIELVNGTPWIWSQVQLTLESLAYHQGEKRTVIKPPEQFLLPNQKAFQIRQAIPLTFFCREYLRLRNQPAKPGKSLSAAWLGADCDSQSVSVSLKSPERGFILPVAVCDLDEKNAPPLPRAGRCVHSTLRIWKKHKDPKMFQIPLLWSFLNSPRQNEAFLLLRYFSTALPRHWRTNHRGLRIIWGESTPALHHLPGLPLCPQWLSVDTVSLLLSSSGVLLKRIVRAGYHCHFLLMYLPKLAL